MTKPITPADVAVITEAQATMYDNINRLLQADVNRLAADNRRLRKALAEIRDADPVDVALDPNWPARIAREALSDMTAPSGG